MKERDTLKTGDYNMDMGNKLARREVTRKKLGKGGSSYGMKRKKAAGGRYMYGKGGMTMEGSQPKYDGMPKCMPN